jgi:hypothetical protein
MPGQLSQGLFKNRSVGAGGTKNLVVPGTGDGGWSIRRLSLVLPAATHARTRGSTAAHNPVSFAPAALFAMMPACMVHHLALATLTN